PGFVEDMRGRGVENVRRLGCMDELKILRDELDIDQAAGDVFEVPALVLALLARNGGAHIGSIFGDQRGSTRPTQHIADYRLDTRAHATSRPARTRKSRR